MSERWLRTAIAGSFKFKPEIDRLHAEFGDHQVEVLEPSIGWLWVPTMPAGEPGFRPLPDEVGMGLRQIEDRFRKAIEISDFLYLHNAEGYVGGSASFELGCAYAAGKPIFAKEPITVQNADHDLGHYALLLEEVVVASPAKAAAIAREGSFDAHRMSPPEINAKIGAAVLDQQYPMYLAGRRVRF